MNEGKEARIRLLNASDKKLALFAVGKANLESLAIANRQTYAHPLTVTIWALFSLAFVHLMNWWPSSHRGLLGILGYLKPLPAFASMAVPMMFLIDWINRPHFEDRTQEAIRKEDMQDPVGHYSRSPGSGFWVLEFGNTFVGMIAVDTRDAKKTKKGTIRHFYVEEAYRGTGIQHDLLHHAVQNAFEKCAALDSIQGVDAPLLTPYIHEGYRQAGFQILPEYVSAGMFGRWKYHTTILDRKDRLKSS